MNKKFLISLIFLTSVIAVFGLTNNVYADCGDTTGTGGTRVACACGDHVTTSVTLRATDPVVTTVCTESGLVIVVGNITVDGGHFAIVGNNSDYAGIDSSNVGHVIIKDFGSAVTSGISGFGTGIGFANTTDGTIENNTIDSNAISGISLNSESSSKIIGNRLAKNRMAVQELNRQVINDTFQNNQFFDNSFNSMFSFAETSTPGVKRLGDAISFTVTAKKFDGTACINCTTINTFPEESSLNYSDDGNGVVTGSFTPTRTGTYSLQVTITDSSGNSEKRNYSFFVAGGEGVTQTTTTYYLHSLLPTHGQPLGNGTDTGTFWPAPAPTSTETRSCLYWVEATPDVIPNYPLAYLSSTNFHIWYNTPGLPDSTEPLAVQRYETYDFYFSSYALPEEYLHDADYYSFLDDSQGLFAYAEKPFNLGWAMDYPWDWYWFSMKLGSDEAGGGVQSCYGLIPFYRRICRSSQLGCTSS